MISEQVNLRLYLSLIGRLDDVGNDGIENIRKIKKSFDTNNVSTK